MVAEVKRPAGQKDQKSFFSSRYFTVILTVGSLVLTGLIGGLFEYLGGQLAQNAATSADPFDNPQVDVFTEWRNRPDFIKLRAEYDGKGRSFSFWDLGYWVDEVEGKIVEGENKYRFKYEDNPVILEDTPWHWEVNLSDRQFQKLNEQYLSDGFKLYKRQEFIGTDGKNRNQAIWRSNRQPQSEDEKVRLLQTASNNSKNTNKGRPEYIVSAIGKAGFDALDKDGDGLMSFAEYPHPEKLKKSNPDVKLRFDKKDRNQDGSLSFKEWFQTRLLSHWSIDHNRDGVVSQAEYLREHEGMNSGVTGEAKAYFKLKDKDGNGELDEAEWMAGKQRPLEHWWKQFDRWWEKNNRNNSVPKDPLSVDPKPVTEKQDQVKNKSKINTLTVEQAAELVADTGDLGQNPDLWLGVLTEINQDVARELAKLQGERLDFKSLTKIDAGVAQELAKFQGKQLFLDSLNTIDTSVAQELAKFKGERLDLRGLSIIDVGVAQELAKFKGFLFLSGLTTIDASVTQELAKFTGGKLNLDGLTTLDADVAQELAEFKGRELFLRGLTTIDVGVAQALAKLKGKELTLGGLTTIDAGVAQELAKFQGERLFLGGLTTIDVGVAQALAEFKGSYLYLRGLTWTSKDKDVAQALENFKGLADVKDVKIVINSDDLNTQKEKEWLKFLIKKVQGDKVVVPFKKINVDVAKELAKFAGEELDLNGLTTIDAGVAQELAKFQGKKLCLGATTTIDAEVAQELAKFQGDHLFLRLTAIDTGVAQELAKFQRGVLQLDDLIRIDEFVAKELAKFEGDCLNLWDLKNIDEFVAKELARSKANNLDLHDLPTINKYVAQELTALRCNTLYLNQIYSIDNDTAQSVGNFQVDRLVLPGLKTISKEAAQAFAKFKGELVLTGIRRMSKEAAQELSKFQGKNLYLNKRFVESENRQYFESNTRITEK